VLQVHEAARKKCGKPDVPLALHLLALQATECLTLEGGWEGVVKDALGSGG
jgi:hypothetical protein